MQQRLYGLIGYPLSHSFSKKYFTEKFEKETISGSQYELFPIADISEINSIINDNPNLIGLNVTIPYKEKVVPFLDELDETAKAVGAVNTIIISRNNSKNYLKGYNTDVYGFRQSIKPFLEINHERALILGTGGASKAVKWVLEQIGIRCNVVSRKVNEGNLSYEDLNEYIIKSHLLIINTTPLGTFPNIEENPDIPYQFVTSNHFLYDLIYNPSETEFLKKGKHNGASGINGFSMLQLQAEKAWEIWNS